MVVSEAPGVSKTPHSQETPSTPLPVTAAILAGGFGTRLKSALSDTPKALAGIHGRPFLAYQFDQLAAAGAQDVVLCTGYLSDQIRDRFRDSYGPLRIGYSPETMPLGTAGALRLALPLLTSDVILVLNGDSYCEADLRLFWDWHQRHQAPASLLTVKCEDAARYGRVSIDERGVVEGFEEKSRSGPGWVNAGIYLISRALLSALPENQPVSLEREFFPQLVGRGLRGYCTSARFLDIGTPESYRVAEEFFAPAGAAR